jgi:uncharacterized protein YdeI (YjbR/CyaY-like superfamily)
VNELPKLSFKTPEAWADWIQANPEAAGVWMKIAKKGTGVTTINYDQALEVALCYGWIDGQLARLDDVFYLQRFTPRRSKGMWSVRNRQLVERLIKEGRMTPAGQVHIDAAKADGRWDAAYESQKNFVIPEDFLKELAKNKSAAEFYKALNRSNLFAIYYRLHSAKKPETRAARMRKIIDTLAAGKKLV